MADNSKVPIFNFTTGEFEKVNGHIKTTIGKEALKVKIEKRLRTELDRFKIYAGTGYGVALENHLVGHTYPADYIKTMIGQNIKDGIMKENGIIDVAINCLTINENTVTWDITVSSEFDTYGLRGGA